MTVRRCAARTAACCAPRGPSKYLSVMRRVHSPSCSSNNRARPRAVTCRLGRWGCPRGLGASSSTHRPARPMYRRSTRCCRSLRLVIQKQPSSQTNHSGVTRGKPSRSIVAKRHGSGLVSKSSISAPARRRGRIGRIYPHLATALACYQRPTTATAALLLAPPARSSRRVSAPDCCFPCKAAVSAAAPASQRFATPATRWPRAPGARTRRRSGPRSWRAGPPRRHR
jgi:hypothetical protein